MTTKTPAERMSRQVKEMIMAHPFYGCVFLHMKRVETRALPTMAVDGVSLFWNPDFVEKLTDAEILGVIAHETMHVALLHFTRQGARNHDKWNRATDYAINQELVAAGFKLPAGGLIDASYKGKDAETIYDLLPDQPSQGDGSGAPGNGPPGAGMVGGSDPGGCGGVMQAPSDSPAGTPAQIAEDWKIRVKQAAVQAEKAGGHIPQSVKLAIAEMNAPVIDWREAFRRFVGDGISDDSSWSRPNKRLISQGLYFPTRVRDRLRRVVVMFDTSGSIGGDDLTADASEAKAMLDDAGCEVMTWACVDTRVRSHGECASGDDVPSINFAGGGGTDFKQAMQWAATLDDVACLVFFTDGYTASWGDDPGFPVLWCGHGRREAWEAVAKNAPFGETIYRGE